MKNTKPKQATASDLEEMIQIYADFGTVFHSPQQIVAGECEGRYKFTEWVKKYLRPNIAN